MYQSSERRGDSPVTIIGAGVAGAWHALLFAQAGHAVTLHERSDAAMTLSTSHWAGGMLGSTSTSRRAGDTSYSTIQRQSGGVWAARSR